LIKSNDLYFILFKFCLETKLVIVILSNVVGLHAHSLIATSQLPTTFLPVHPIETSRKKQVKVSTASSTTTTTTSSCSI